MKPTKLRAPYPTDAALQCDAFRNRGGRVPGPRMQLRLTSIVGVFTHVPEGEGGDLCE